MVGSSVVAQELIDAGADVDAVSSDNGNTPLHYAILKGSLAIRLMLLKNNASTSLINAQGKKALDLEDKVVETIEDLHVAKKARK